MTDKQQIKSILTQHRSSLRRIGVKQIGLFGSYVRAQQNAASDIDLLVDFQEGMENFDNLMELYDLLESAFGGEKIEIVTKNGLSPHIGPQILEEVEYV